MSAYQGVSIQVQDNNSMFSSEKKSTMKFSGVYYIFTALVLTLSTFIVNEVFSVSAASHILRNIYICKKTANQISSS